MSGNKCLQCTKQPTRERVKKKPPNLNIEKSNVYFDCNEIEYERVDLSWKCLCGQWTRVVHPFDDGLDLFFSLHYYKYENWSAAICTGILLALKYTHTNTVSVSQPNNQKKIEMRKWTAFLREIMCNDDVYIGKL